MGSRLDQLQKKSCVIIHISNPQIQQHQYAKMASFKILLVVALVAFIGSSDALKCLTKQASGPAKSADCGDQKSCVITAKITLEPAATVVTKQACDAKDLGETTTKKFEVPDPIVKDSEVSYYCKADDCNVEQEIKNVLKEDSAKTIAEMKKVAPATVATKAADIDEANVVGGGAGGAAQTTVCCCHHRLQYGHGPSCSLNSLTSTVFFSVECL